MNKKYLLHSMASLLLLTGVSLSEAEVIEAGAGSYTTEKPDHRWQPATAVGFDQTVPEGEPWGIHTPRKEQSPSVSQFFESTGKPTPTHEFWSSVMWEFAVENLIRDENGGIVETNTDMVPYGHWMSNSPYTMKFTNTGVNLTYAQTPLLVPYRFEDPNSSKPVLPSVDDPKFTAYTYPARIDPNLHPLGGTELNLEVEGLDAEQTLLDDYTDFSARILLNNPDSPESSDYLKVTATNGSPFLHFEKDGLGDVVLTYFNGMRIIHESDGTLALYLGDARTGYAIYAPPGTEFDYTLANLDLQELTSRGKITMSLPEGERHFSLAILPNEINDIFSAPNSYTEQGFEVEEGMSVNDLPTHIEGTHQPLVVARLVGDFFREDDPSDGAGVEELDELVLDYRSHAFAHPVNTQFSYDYNESEAEVVSSYRVDTDVMVEDPDAKNTTLMGLYRHQYLNMDTVDHKYTYNTPRGLMKVIEGNQFNTRMQHPGLLPNLPNALEGEQLSRLVSLLDEDKEGQWPGGLTRDDVIDTYNNGKELNWMLQLLHIAHQVGEDQAFDTLMAEMKSHVEDWLSAEDWVEDREYDSSHCDELSEPDRSTCFRELRQENERKYYYYNEEWNSMTGFPASFGSDTELNDHHFHSGYLISAAAAIARYDKAWAEQWKPMIDLLIKDSANWDKSDDRFQYLRYFDIYNGYSLANGHLNMDAGGNQESSSESVNFAQAVALWGSEMQDPEIRDLGVFLYTSEVNAIHQYWFDVDNEVFPKEVFWDDGGQFVKKDFDRSSVGLVWHSKADYGTWFSAAPRMIAGINFLPITGASLHLGHMERVREDGSTIPSVQLIMDRMAENTRFFAEDLYHREQPEGAEKYDFRRKTHFWDDLMWMAQALADPQAAADKFEQAGDYVREFHDSLPPLYPNAEVRGEAGESKTHTYHWIYNLLALGTPVKDVTANTPYYAVFDKNGQRTHVAYNATETTKLVQFSDGVAIEVPPGEVSGGVDVDLAPAVLNLTLDSLGSDQAGISWDPLEGDWQGASYRVELLGACEASGCTTQLVTGNSAVFDELTPDNSYRARVTSIFDEVDGRSTELAFTTDPDLSVVPPVENLRLESVGREQALVRWDPIKAVYENADYRVRLERSGTSVQEVASTGGQTEQSLTVLEPGVDYRLSVWATNDGIDSEPSQITFSTEAEAPACDPNASDYCIEAFETSIRITLNRDAVWADIHLDAPSQSGGFRMPQDEAGQSFFEVVDLSEGSEVTFEFTYFDTVGHELGPFTYQHSASESDPEPEPESIPQVSGLTVSSITQESANFSWESLSGDFSSASYELEVLESGEPLFTQMTSDTASFLSELTPQTDYQVTVRAMFEGELGPKAQTFFTTLAAGGGDPGCQEASGIRVCQQASDGALRVFVEAQGWAVIHAPSGNFGMAEDASGQFVHDFTNMSEGDSVQAWFTVNTANGAVDTETVTFTYSGSEDADTEEPDQDAGTEEPAEESCTKEPGEVCTEWVDGALRVNLYGATDWAVIHYAAGNFHMTQGSEGEFFFDIEGVAEGEGLSIWFTINTPDGAYDSEEILISG